MSEIERIRRYIRRTRADENGRYRMNFAEAMNLAYQENTVEMLALVFEYGKAKGWRAARAERRAEA